MNSITAFFNMSGYGVYIWPSYVIAGLILCGNVISSYRFSQRIRRNVSQKYE